MLRRSKKIFGLTVRLGVPLCVLSGCVAYNFSSEFLPLPENQAKAMFQNLTIGIEPAPDKSQSYNLEKFVDDLRKSGLFKSVRYLEKRSAADLVLSSFAYKGDDPYRACLLGFEGQIATIATIGLVPQICKSEYQISFFLHAPKNQQKKKPIAFSYQTRSIVGWAALFYAPSPGWSFKPEKEQYSELLKAVFYKEADDILRLLQ
ncbi:MAG TPA: hypothetical protein VFU31_20390 [Candidatus Binatia bacterium]|nr:hypothetical protein [Candidatus Binatia bacterium]